MAKLMSLCFVLQLKELDREDARKRPGGIVLRTTWKLGLSPKDAQSRNKRRRIIKGQPTNRCSRRKMAVKTWCSAVTVSVICACFTFII